MAQVLRSLAGLFVVGLIGVAGLLVAAPRFPRPAYGGDGVTVAGVAVADFNNDGLLDLAVVAPDDENVGVLLGESGGSYVLVASYAVGIRPGAVVAADFDGDGSADLAVANRGCATEFCLDSPDGVLEDLSVRLNTGSGTFGPEARYPVGEAPGALVTGDFDGNGSVDLATANRATDDVSVLLGAGDGTFASESRHSTGGRPIDLAVGHFDSGDTQDLVVVNSSTFDLSILLGTGNGGFAPEYRVVPDSRPKGVAVGDFEPDGAQDLALAGTSPSSVSILTGDGAGGFTAGGSVPVLGAQRIAVGDLNGDGVQDLATNASFEDLVVVLGLGGGAFADAIRSRVGTIGDKIILQDMNGDGRQDIVAALTYDAAVLSGNGDGTFEQENRVATVDFPSEVTVGDVDGDGVTDLVTAEDVTVFLGVGDGTFGAVIPGTAEGQSPIVADFDGDGAEDLALRVRSSPEGVAILLSNADGTFREESQALIEDTLDMVAGDFNSDGEVDIAVFSVHVVDRLVTLLLGDGDGDFTAGPTYSQLRGLVITTGDFNADGHADLASTFRDRAWTALGNGDGTFGDASEYDVGWNYGLLGRGRVDIVSADFNSDGLDDLALPESGRYTCQKFVGPTCYDRGNLAVLFAQPDGSFDAPVYYPLGVGADSAGTADLNGDGLADVVTMNSDSGNVSVLIATPGGAFTPENRYGVGRQPGSIAIADFDQDGRPDIATVVDSSHDIAVLLQNDDEDDSGVSEDTLVLEPTDGLIQFAPRIKSRMH